MKIETIVSVVLALLLYHMTVHAQAPNVVSVSPAPNELNVSQSAHISMTFDIDIDAATINDATFVVHT